MEYVSRKNKRAEIQRQQDHWNEVHADMIDAQQKNLFQAKSLEISSPGDADEKEADEVARKVMNGQSAEITGAGAGINRKGEGDTNVSSDFQAQLSSSKGGGQPLQESVKSEMESKMGADFSDVKIHTGASANQMSESINARAFTHGQDVYFKNGEHNTSSSEGKELLAHELVHTVQQGSGKINPKIQRVVDWTVSLDKTKALSKDVTDEIEKNRAAIVVNSGIEKSGSGYKYWPESTVNDDIDPTEIDNEKHPFKKRMYNAIWYELSREGGTSSVNAYDNQIFTWGKGMSGKYFLDDLMAKLFTKNTTYKQNFLDVGINYDKDGLLVVDTKAGTDYGMVKDDDDWGAQKLIQGDTRLISFFTNIAEAATSRQDVMDSQWEVIRLNAARIPDYVYSLQSGAENFGAEKGKYKDDWSDKSVALAAHLSHWLWGASWGKNGGAGTSYEITKGDPTKIIMRFVRVFAESSMTKKPANGALVFEFDNAYDRHFSHMGVSSAGGTPAGETACTAGGPAYSLPPEIFNSLTGLNDFILIRRNTSGYQYFVLPYDYETTNATAQKDFKEKIKDVDIHSNLESLTAKKLLTNKAIKYSDGELNAVLDQMKKGAETGYEKQSAKYRVVFKAALLMHKNGINGFGAKSGYTTKNKKALWADSEVVTLLSGADFMGLDAQDQKDLKAYLKDPSVKNKSLEISSPADADEVEADEIARKVVQGQNAEVQLYGNQVQRKGEGNAEAPAEFQSTLQSSKGSGQSLDDSTRNEMESKMGADFSGVKIHTGGEASQMSESINARAFTHGQDVYFKQGEFDTSSSAGKELLAHELVHTVQQGKGKVSPKIQRQETYTGYNIKIGIPISYDSLEILDGAKKVVYTDKSSYSGGSSESMSEITLPTIGLHTLKIYTKVGEMDFFINPGFKKFVLHIFQQADPEHSFMGKTFTTSVDAPLFTIARGDGENTFTPEMTVVGKAYDVTKSTIPINTPVSIIENGTHLEKQKSGGFKEVAVAEVADKTGKSLGWTTRSNISEKPDGTKMYKIISGSASIRSAPSDVSGPKTIPKGTQLYVKQLVRDNYKDRNVYALVVDKESGTEYGWISSASIEGKLIGETMGRRQAKFESTDPQNKTVGAAIANITVEKGVYYDEIMPTSSNTIPEGSSIEVLDNGKEYDNYPNKKVIRVKVAKVKDAKDNDWLQRAPFWITSTYKGAADGVYFKVIKGASARSAPVPIFESAGTTLAQGSFVIVKETKQGASPKVSGKPLEPTEFIKVAYTKEENNKTVEDTSKEQVWTKASNLVENWADFKGGNAMWRKGAYIGQTEILEIVGEFGDQRQLRPGTATDKFLAMAEDARLDGVSLYLRSGFRDYAHQAYLFSTSPKGKAAQAGHSEHQAGFALDIEVDAAKGAYDWLIKNGPSHGFVRTVSTERWHWEYIPEKAKNGWQAY